VTTAEQTEVTTAEQTEVTTFEQTSTAEHWMGWTVGGSAGSRAGVASVDQEARLPGSGRACQRG